ncbi:MAG: NarK/NasA family nitrate transporter [Candidatus Scalindua sp. AMX11]|nr:MAG: NarK/NasA family nitrate transporter [Candidatus Scalindua sp.]NOG84961.1 NarK/NasA family nitrate transporter [Planctomycetota bacterium]RZV93017.1 MAG: NarK/NasA family nitrate transporter [Candidatus Scalindua sp. SCAELEC01]TDE66637.1 MAG: NarK/NasA family nitrate transporter [Candidatus Scalindua sp. AMX11]GJQ57944.1 MAG: MFS transporter [Candidatus Scalindua sp.]
MSNSAVTLQGNTRVLILGTLAFAVCFAGWSLFGPLAVYMKAEFNLSSSAVGLLLATPVLLGSIVRVPIGILTDEYGGRKIFSALMLFTFFPMFFATFVHSYPMLLLCGFFFGVAGASFAVGIPQISQWYPKEKQGLALGIYGVGNVGTALAVFGAPVIAESIGWNKVFIFYSFPLLGMAAIYWFFSADAPKPKNARPQTFSDKIKVYKSSHLIWVFSLFYFMTFGFFVCFALFLPSYLIDTFGVTPIKAGTFTSIFVFLATFVRILGGYLGDKFSGRNLLTILSLSLIGVLFYLNLNSSLTLGLAAFYCMACLLGIGNGVVFKLVAEYFPKDTGTVGGLVGAAGGLGGFFLPIAMGTIKDYTNNNSLGFIFISLVCLMCLSFMEKKTFRKSDSTITEKESTFTKVNKKSEPITL